MKIVLVISSVLLLAACNTVHKDSVVGSSTPPPVSSPDASVSIDVPLIGQSASAAEDFMRAFEVAEHDAIFSKSFDAAIALTSEACPCRQDLLTIKDSLEKTSGTIKPFGYKTLSAKATHISGDVWSVHLVASHDAYDLIGADGKSLHTFEAAKSGGGTFTVEWQGSKWIVTDEKPDA